MKPLRSRTISRRAMLRGAGGVAISLPFLRAMNAFAADPVSTVPKRFIFWYTPNGFQESVYPRSLDLAGTSLAPLEPFRDQLIVTRGLSYVSTRFQDEAPHVAGYAHCLTGDVADTAEPRVNRAEISVDQFLARRLTGTRFPLLLHGVGRIRYPISWDPSGHGVLPVEDPQVAFSTLFGGFEGTEDERARAELSRGSILDAVRESYRRMSCDLGGEDRRRMERHFDQLRDLEVGVAAGGCTAPTAPGAIDVAAARNHATAMRRHSEMMVKAFECDLTRVGGLQWYSSSSFFNQRYEWDGLGVEHHEASHSNRHGMHVEKFAGELAYLLGLLRDAEAEDGSSMLDHTVVVWVSELGLNSNTHHMADLGVVLAGSAGGHLRTGRYVDFLADHRHELSRAPDWKARARGGVPSSDYFLPYDVPHNDLWVELINAVSPPELEPVTTFGMPELCSGGLPQLRA